MNVKKKKEKLAFIIGSVNVIKEKRLNYRIHVEIKQKRHKMSITFTLSHVKDVKLRKLMV